MKTIHEQIGCNTISIRIMMNPVRIAVSNKTHRNPRHYSSRIVYYLNRTRMARALDNYEQFVK